MRPMTNFLQSGIFQIFAFGIFAEGSGIFRASCGKSLKGAREARSSKLGTIFQNF